MAKGRHVSRKVLLPRRICDSIAAMYECVSKGWQPNWPAVDRFGSPVNPSDPSARAFSTRGALAYVAPKNVHLFAILDRLERWAASQGCLTWGQWEQYRWRTQQEILTALMAVRSME